MKAKAGASTLVKELRDLARKTGQVLAGAQAKKDYELASKAIARIERQLELKARRSMSTMRDLFKPPDDARHLP